MPDFKGLAKGGWHPSFDKTLNKDNLKDKLNKDNLKDNLKYPRGLLSRGGQQDPNQARRDHQSTPLSSLKDPDSFAPPPKHSAYYDADGTNRACSPIGSSSGAVAPATTRRPPPPQSRGLGAALSPEQIQQQSLAQRQEEEEADKPKPPPAPYRVDTSGLSTAHLPKPPVRRADGASASPVTAAPIASPVVKKPGPSLPPRLPPRQNEYPDHHTPAPPPTYGQATERVDSTIAPNQGALHRLGQAGVSIPDLDIGQNTSTSRPSSSGPRQASQLNELQQRFANMGGDAGSPTSPLSHGSQHLGNAATASAAAASKKPPPPPPKKKELAVTEVGSGPAPPPVPVSSKPRPG